MWAEKYRPSSCKEVVGQDLAIANIKHFINNYDKLDKKAILVHGPSGTGKNTVIHAICSDLDLEIIEFNASQLRDAKEIKSILGPATQQYSLFGKGKIIFIDETEAFTRFDRGGLTGVISLIKESKWPIIFSANDLWDKKLNDLRRKINPVEIKKVDYNNVTKALRRVCEKESLEIDKESLDKISIKSRGDIRAAINDLQSLIFLDKINEEIIDSLGEREKEESIFNSIRAILKSKDAKDVLNVFDNVNLPLDECILWLDENIPLEYKGEELILAYKALSKSDIFKRRIMRHQHWRFLIYVNILATAGVAAAKMEEKRNYVSYKRTGRILKLWMAKQKNLKRRALAEKLSRIAHFSKKKAYKELPIFETIFRHSDEDTINAFSKNLRLNEVEAEYVQSLRNS